MRHAAASSTLGAIDRRELPGQSMCENSRTRAWIHCFIIEPARRPPVEGRQPGMVKLGDGQRLVTLRPSAGTLAAIGFEAYP